MTVCPKHRFQLTTLYKAKVMDRDFLMDDGCTSLIWHYNIPGKPRARKPIFIGKPFEGSVHTKTAHHPRLKPCYFPTRVDCSLSWKICLLVVDIFYLRVLNEFHLFPSDATTLLTLHFLYSNFSPESRSLIFYMWVCVTGKGGGGVVRGNTR